MNEYVGMSYPQALRHLSKNYIRKPECKEVLEQTAKLIEAYEKAIESMSYYKILGIK